MTELAARMRPPTGTGTPMVRSAGAAGSIEGAAKARSQRQSSPMRTMVVPPGGTNAPLPSANASPLRTTTSRPPRPSGTPLSPRVSLVERAHCGRACAVTGS